MENNKENKICSDCTNDEIAIQTENACSCKEHSRINYIPNEYFYNSCECDSCDCENYSDSSDSKMICSCGYIVNPLGSSFDNYTCDCNNINLYN